MLFVFLAASSKELSNLLISYLMSFEYKISPSLRKSVMSVSDSELDFDLIDLFFSLENTLLFDLGLYLGGVRLLDSSFFSDTDFFAIDGSSSSDFVLEQGVNNF